MSRVACLLLVLAACSADAARSPSSPAGANTASVGGRELRDVVAEIDPFGALEVRGVGDDGAHALTIRFTEWNLPAKGEHRLGDAAVSLLLDGALQTGTLQVQEFSWSAAAVSGSCSGRAGEPPRAFAFQVAPTRKPAVIIGQKRIVPTDVGWPRDTPDPEDIVFCAIGNTGTGGDGQRRIGKAIAELAPTGPLDFVVMLGDSFMPRGVQSSDDPLWRRCFEDPYPEALLPMPFYAVPGGRDLLGNRAALFDYGKTNSRWTMPGPAYNFVLQSHGKKVSFIGIDTAAYLGDVDPETTRSARQTLRSCIESSEATWHIMFGYTPFYCHGEGGKVETSKRLDELGRRQLEEVGIDFYIASGDHHLELVQPKTGLVQITSGGGGGPEAARSMTWGDDTVFAHTGGGFTWLRFDGQTWEVSFRDNDGRVLYVQHLFSK
jgi:hypothetical protein